MKYKLTAVIPVAQYANLQPSFEVEAETFEEAQAQIMPHMQAVWDKYGEKPLTSKAVTTTTASEKVACFAGGSINFDAASHTYTNDKGEVYLSGSKYASQFEKPFNAELISGLIAKKFDIDQAAILKMWELKGSISSGFGTALHAALELYGRYEDLATTMGKTTHLHDHPVIQKAVESFYAGRELEVAGQELFVVDHKAKHVGQIDRLLITGTKICRVQDYKTNAVLSPEKLKIYWHQLRFYGAILEADGWTVNGYDIFHWNGEWTTISKERDELDLELAPKVPKTKPTKETK